MRSAIRSNAVKLIPLPFWASVAVFGTSPIRSQLSDGDEMEEIELRELVSSRPGSRFSRGGGGWAGLSEDWKSCVLNDVWVPVEGCKVMSSELKRRPVEVEKYRVSLQPEDASYLHLICREFAPEWIGLNGVEERLSFVKDVLNKVGVSDETAHVTLMARLRRDNYRQMLISKESRVGCYSRPNKQNCCTRDCGRHRVLFFDAVEGQLFELRKPRSSRVANGWSASDTKKIVADKMDELLKRDKVRAGLEEFGLGYIDPSYQQKYLTSIPRSIWEMFDTRTIAFTLRALHDESSQDLSRMSKAPLIRKSVTTPGYSAVPTLDLDDFPPETIRDLTPPSSMPYNPLLDLPPGSNSSSVSDLSQEESRFPERRTSAIAMSELAARVEAEAELGAPKKVAVPVTDKRILGYDGIGFLDGYDWKGIFMKARALDRNASALDDLTWKDLSRGNWASRALFLNALLTSETFYASHLLHRTPDNKIWHSSFQAAKPFSRLAARIFVIDEPKASFYQVTRPPTANSYFKPAEVEAIVHRIARKWKSYMRFPCTLL